MIAWDNAVTANPPANVIRSCHLANPAAPSRVKNQKINNRAHSALFIHVPIEEKVNRLYEIRAMKNKGMPIHRVVLCLQTPAANRGHNLSPTFEKLITIPNNANAASIPKAVSILIQLMLELSSTPKRCARPRRSQTASRQSPAVITRMVLNTLRRDGFENIFGSFRLSAVRRPPHG